jgi:hypothetical protein
MAGGIGVHNPCIKMGVDSGIIDVYSEPAPLDGGRSYVLHRLGACFKFPVGIDGLADDCNCPRSGAACCCCLC